MNTQRFVILRFGLGILLMAGAALAENPPPEPKGKAGLPFTERELVSLVRSKQVSETALAEQVEQRGVAFCPGESSKKKLLRAGAGTGLLKTVARVGEDRACRDLLSAEEDRRLKKLAAYVMTLPDLGRGYGKLSGVWYGAKLGSAAPFFARPSRAEVEALTRQALYGKALVEAVARDEERHQSVAVASPAKPAVSQSGQAASISRETLIAQAGSQALKSSAELPDFSCLEATKRSVDFFGRGDLFLHDGIVARLTRRGPEENYKVVTVNNDITARVSNRLPRRFDEEDAFVGLASRLFGAFAGVGNVAAHALLANPFETVKSIQSFKRVYGTEADTRITSRPREFPAGPVTMEEFMAPLRDLFQPERGTKPSWVRSEIEHGRPMEVFDYDVADMLSSWKLPFSGQDSIHVAYRGRVWVDRATRQVQRISLTAADLPEDFAITAAQMNVEYEEVEISGRTWLLPLEATVVITQGKPSYPPPSGGVTTRLEIGFRGYREAPAEAPGPPFPVAGADAGQAWVDFCARNLASGKSDSLYTCRFDPLGAMVAAREARHSADTPVPEHLRPENQER